MCVINITINAKSLLKHRCCTNIASSQPARYTEHAKLALFANALVESSACFTTCNQIYVSLQTFTNLTAGAHSNSFSYNFNNLCDNFRGKNYCFISSMLDFLGKKLDRTFGFCFKKVSMTLASFAIKRQYLYIKFSDL